MPPADRSRAALYRRQPRGGRSPGPVPGRPPASPGWSGRLLVMLVVLATARAGRAVDRTDGRSGGLVPNAGASREELIRQWDLDGDGTISKPEADVARGRMRRQRLDMQARATIDPITGAPRSLEHATGENERSEPVFQLPPELPELPASARPQAARRAAAGELPQPQVDAAPRAPVPATGTPPPAAQPAMSSRASWLPPQPLTPATRGGVRAGAPAAVPGYGAGRWGDLNAGRRPTPPRFDGSPADGAAISASGGLLPAGRPAGRSGALVVPGQSRGGPAAGQRPTPATPPPARPRITADEIGGGLP